MTTSRTVLTTDAAPQLSRDRPHDAQQLQLEADLRAPFSNNRFNFQNTWAEKVRNARDARDTRPIETTYRQKAVVERRSARSAG